MLVTPEIRNLLYDAFTPEEIRDEMRQARRSLGEARPAEVARRSVIDGFDETTTQVLQLCNRYLLENNRVPSEDWVVRQMIRRSIRGMGQVLRNLRQVGMVV